MTRRGVAVANEEKVTVVSNADTDSNTSSNTITNMEATSAQMLRLPDRKLETNYAAWEHMTDCKKSPTSYLCPPQCNLQRNGFLASSPSRCLR